MSSKILVAYFSCSKVTEGAAKFLAKAANADLFEIKPKAAYTKADLDWTNKKSRSSVEMNDKAYRPEMAEKPADIKKYDTVFLGFPIWWYVAPTIVNTFLESCDFSGKTIILFATSGSSGMGKTAQELKVSVPESCTIKEGRMLTGASYDEIKEWVSSQEL